MHVYMYIYMYINMYIYIPRSKVHAQIHRCIHHTYTHGRTLCSINCTNLSPGFRPILSIISSAVVVSRIEKLSNNDVICASNASKRAADGDACNLFV